jgi:adenylate cyclase
VEKRLPRKLVAILYADVAGYSRLTGEDEDATHRSLSEYLDLISATIESHGGRTVHYAGDAVLARFEAVVDALASAVSIQGQLEERNAELPDERKVRFRVGVNLGDVIEDRGDIYGDGVNVAARLESLADEGGVCISESVRTAIGNKLELSYESMGERQVKNIAEPVRAFKVMPASRGNLAPAATTNPQLRQKPSIAVLAFDNMSGDPEQEYFADGLAEDIITELSREPDLFVIARNSSFAYKGQPADIRQIATELGVSFVLEGSVRRSGKRIRLNAQLVAGETGNHIWAERYDRALEDVFEVQDELTSTIFNTLLQKVRDTGIDQAMSRTPCNIDAYEHLLRAWGRLQRMNAADIAESRREAEAALAIDASSARAHCALAWAHLHSVLSGPTEDAKESFELAHRSARESVTLDRSDFWSHGALGFSELFMGHHDRALASIDRAIALNPNNADVHALRGQALNFLDRPKEGLEEMELAVRHNPHHPDWYLLGFCRAYYVLGRHDEAAPYLERLTGARPEYVAARLAAAANNVALGRVDEARAEVERILEAKPNLTLTHVRALVPYKNEEALECYLGHLRQAGLPE